MVLLTVQFLTQQQPLFEISKYIVGNNGGEEGKRNATLKRGSIICCYLVNIATG